MSWEPTSHRRRSKATPGETHDWNEIEGHHASLVSGQTDGASAPTSPSVTGMLEEAMLFELAELASSAGAQVVGQSVQRSPAPNPATLIGRGKVEELRVAARAAGADCIIFDQDLTPTQLRNLERALDRKVLDRTQLILDIFARRALSREGKLQVELAQLNYLLPRLGGRGTLLSRLGGGIGTRGPGEQQLEFDRRRIRARIQRLSEAIERVRQQRALHRAHRRARQFHIVALIGYTNAGKSTLFNALSRAHVTASSRLFATLDPTVRALKLPSRRPALLSDTVGFIQKLPPHLVAAFRATLEELDQADLLLHVTDASHPEREQQDAAVEDQIESLGLTATRRLRVWNKVDQLDSSQIQRLPNNSSEVPVSARTGFGLQDLVERIDHNLASEAMIEAQFDWPSADGRRLAMLYRLGQVLSTHFENDRVRIQARVTESVRDRLLSGEALTSGRFR